MSLVELIELPSFVDARGSLVAIEGKCDVPFAIKRVYYLHSTTLGASRGFHAHKRLQQVLVCVSGSCRVVLDDASRREEVFLAKPSIGLLIQHNIWREMYDFSDNCILLVLASEQYSEDDYIRDYDEFLMQVKL